MKSGILHSFLAYLICSYNILFDLLIPISFHEDHLRLALVYDLLPYPSHPFFEKIYQFYRLSLLTFYLVIYLNNSYFYYSML